MYKYFIYCRKSVDEKKEYRLLSIDSQREVLLNIAKQDNLDIVDILEEKRTAFVPGRPVFNNMMERIEKEEADRILVWKIAVPSLDKYFD